MKITSCKEQIEFETLYFLQFGQRFWHKEVLNNSCHFLVYLPVQQSRARFFAPCATKTQHEIGIKKKKGVHLDATTQTQAPAHTHIQTNAQGQANTHTPKRKSGSSEEREKGRRGFSRVLTSSDGHQTDLQKVGVQTLSRGWNQQLMREHKQWSSPA